MKDHLRKIQRVENKHTTGHRAHAGERQIPFPSSKFSDLINNLTQEDFIQYPDVAPLKKRLAAKHGVSESNIMLSSGSDNILSAIFHTYLGVGDTVVLPELRFPMYDVYAAQCGANVYEMPYLGEVLDTRIPDIDPKLVVLANPNSPVGDIPEIPQTICPLVVDEAYVNFGSSSVGLVPNTLVVKSFSKDYGLAGIRVGYVIAEDKLIEQVSSYRHMFEVTGVSVKAALWALDNESLMHEYTSVVMKEKETLRSMGYKVTVGNWVHFEEDLYDSFSSKGIHVKKASLFGKPVIRVTVFPGLSNLLKTP